MTTKKLVRGLIVTVAFCLSTTAGRAQDKLIFVTVGGTSLKDNRSFLEDFIPYNTGYANGGAGTVGIELPLKRSKVFGLDVSYSYSQNNLELTETDTSPYTVTSYGVRDNRLSGDIVLHSPSTFRGARPYAVAGVEFDRYSPSSSATSLATTIGFAKQYPAATLSSENDGGVNFGGGIDYKLTSKVDLRIDIRDHVTPSPTLGLPYGSTPTSKAYYPISGKASNIEYTIGIVFHFGREKPSTAETKSPQPRPSRRASSQKMPSYPPSPF